ncbi:MAG: DUF4167 domain-containing protein [Alphaproteobacteria bacterium]|nr:DUF4167 domain-containing protein [Alphaproteobacteria bacterium]
MIKNTYSKSSQSRSNGGRSDNNRGDNRRHDGQRDNNRNNVRVNPREQHQKYLNMAREAISAGNHVQAEEFYQHAEHYYRVMNERNNYASPAPAPQQKAPVPEVKIDTETPLLIPVETLVQPVSPSPVMEVPVTQRQEKTEDKPKPRRPRTPAKEQVSAPEEKSDAALKME